MDVDKDYPVILYGEMPGYARLLTAIHIACVDAGGTPFGVEYTEQELQNFYDSSAHRYFSVEPVGNLKKAASLVAKAIVASVDSGELKPAATRKSLSGELSLVNSWVAFEAFEAWCESRAIKLDESWLELLKEDGLIYDSAAEEMDTKRRKYEGLYDYENVDDLAKKLDEEGIESLFEEISVLRSKLNECKANAAPKDKRDNLHPKRETTYLNIIAALVELIQSPMPGRDSDAAVIRELVDNYGDRPGISKRNLEDVFPVAKKRLQSD